MRTVKYDGKIFAAPCLCDKRPKPAALTVNAYLFDLGLEGTIKHKGFSSSAALRKLLPEKCSVCHYYPWIVLPKERK